MNAEELNLPIEKMPPCFIKIDLTYPINLHDKFSELVPAPDNIIPKGSKVKKLAPNLYSKKGYVCHIRNLRLYKKLGVKITKIRRGLKFEEKPWLKSYIDLNTNLQAKATNEADKDMYKLLNNAVFGKTCENLLNRTEYKLVSSREEALKLIAKPTFKDYTEYNKKLAGIHLDPYSVTSNKPSYVGVAILDLSKVLMYDFHYNNVKTRYGGRAKIDTDTDSLFYSIETKDWYEDIREDIPMFYDTSDYPEDHPANLPKMNKKVIGKFKDELKGETVDEFCGTCAKSYAFTVCGEEEQSEKKKCKGIKKSVAKKKLTIEDYKNCVLGQNGKTVKQTQFRSYEHEIFTEQITKVALSPYDDKRVILEDGIRTLPIGHWRTKHPNLHDIEMDVKQLGEKGSLMNLAYDAINGM